jgi:acetyl esterase/lipase
MRRWLACAVAAELVVAGLVVGVVTKDTRSSRPYAERGTAVLPRAVDGNSYAAGSPDRASSSSRHGRPHSSRRIGAHDLGGSNDVATVALEGQITFAKPRDFATGAQPSTAAWNAVQGDQLPHLHQAHATLSDGVAVGDFDGDGHDDVAQTNVIAGTLSVFRGTGRGGFASPNVQPVGLLPNFVVAGHLDLDDTLDLAVANVGSNNVAILLGDGAGGFAVASVVPVPAPRNVAIGDFNADHVPDFAVASGPPACPRDKRVQQGPVDVDCFRSVSPAGGVVILTGTGGPGRLAFVPTQVVTHVHSGTGQPVSANYVAVGDFDGSGFDDLAVGVGASASAGDQEAGSTGTMGDDVLVYLNRNGAASPPFDSSPSQPALRVGASPDAIVVGDWNGDRHPDLAVLGSTSGDITTLLGGSAGRFTVKTRNATVGNAPRSLAVADFDDDGLADLVTTGFASSTISGLRGNGDGTFRPAVDFWAGEAPTAVDVGHFDGDRRIDVVVARLRTDQLTLLANASPHGGDGVEVTRDVPYLTPAGDPLAAHHTLDVYEPPTATTSLAGVGKRYPVVLFAHGGGGIANNKTMYSYLMRSLAREGVVAVSTNYRLEPNGGTALTDAQVSDVANAFRWTRAHVGSQDFGGDPDNIVVFGYSAGAIATLKIASAPDYAADRSHMRAMVLAGCCFPQDTLPGLQDPTSQPPALVLGGTEGAEVLLRAGRMALEAWRLRGADVTRVVVDGRDHLTLVADIAVPGDPARVALLNFLRTKVSNP